MIESRRVNAFKCIMLKAKAASEAFFWKWDWTYIFFGDEHLKIEFRVVYHGSLLHVCLKTSVF